jgi:phosphate:Na+ symporter
MDITQIFLLCGGLGLFLYGMNLMSEGLEKAAGDRLRIWLKRLTSNRFLGILLGALVTAIIQSSSATSVITIGFINAGLMTLSQAIGVLMGANIGTTITGVLIAFNFSDIAPLFILAGAIMYLFSNRRFIKYLGMVILGFGALFLGIELMGNSLASLKSSAAFTDIILTLKNPLLGILAGTIMTAIIQSSSAFTGILLTLAANGMITFEVAFPLLLGANIGTCVTALMASIGTLPNARRTAYMHLIIKVIGVTVAYLLSLFISFPNMMQSLVGNNPEWEIAGFHVIFNIANTILLLPFADKIVKLAMHFGKDNLNEMYEKALQYINEKTFQTPTLIVAQLLKEADRMRTIVDKNLQLAINAILTNNNNDANTLLEHEATINYLNHHITPMLVKAMAYNISDYDKAVIGELFKIIVDFERVADHAENIMEYVEVMKTNKLVFSNTALDEIKRMSDAVYRLFTMCSEAYFARDISSLSNIAALESEVDEMQTTFKENHIQRLYHSECDPRSSGVFTDLITDFERIGDHSTNIVYALLNYEVQLRAKI